MHVRRCGELVFAGPLVGERDVLVKLVEGPLRPHP